VELLPPIIQENARVIDVNGLRRRIINAGFLSVWWAAEAHFDSRYHELPLAARQAFKHLVAHFVARRRERAEECRIARERRQGRWALIAENRLALTSDDVSALHDRADQRPHRDFSAFVDEYVDAELEEAA
jgi:hypothetical protein